MRRKEFAVFLILELIAIAWAGAVFALFTSRLLAGALAGSYFLGFGLFLLLKLWRSGEPWKWLTFYPALIHVFVITLPMLITRWWYADQPFEQVHILGLEGPVFHKLSTYVFTGLLAATVIDLFRAKK